MNRKQRRKLDRVVGMKGFGKVVDAATSAPVLSEGDRVMIRHDQIVNRTDYVSKNEAYKAFIEQNRDTVFTVHKVNAEKEHSLIELAEDESRPKWLWWEGDLRKIFNADKTHVL